jgi:hypothetical protein
VAAVTVVLGESPYVQQVPGAALRPMRGYGAQLFPELFETQTETPAELAAQIAPLRLGHCRVAVAAAAARPGRAREALMRTLALAHDAGANANLTWWHGPYFRNPQSPSEEGFLGPQLMRDFAGVIEEARHRFRCATHVTIQNEVNAHDIAREGRAAASMKLYERLYRLLDTELKARRDPRQPAKSLRSAVQLVGGDLVLGGPAGIPGSNQADWIRFMQRHMKDVLNGYSIHVYWTNGHYARFEQRLARLLDFRIEKPVYVTEYAVRGTDFPQDERLFQMGSVRGENVEDSRESAFQHAWFNALAPHYGVVGFAKWACWRIDRGTGAPLGQRRPERDSGMLCGIGKAFAATPNYRVTLLFNRLVGRNWKAAQLAVAGDTLASTFAGPKDQHALVVLNRGREANDVSVDRLVPGGRYRAVGWNHDDDGALRSLAAVTADGSGVVAVTVPPSALVALSTRPFGIRP